MYFISYNYLIRSARTPFIEPKKSEIKIASYLNSYLPVFQLFNNVNKGPYVLRPGADSRQIIFTPCLC